MFCSIFKLDAICPSFVFKVNEGPMLDLFSNIHILKLD